MPVPFSVEPQPDSAFLVTLQEQGGPVESWIHVTDEVCSQLNVEGQDRGELVERTVRFLLRHQAPADFPALVDLEDVLAGHPEFGQFLSGEQPADDGAGARARPPVATRAAEPGLQPSRAR